MRSWLSSWLSLWTLGACATLGLGLIVVAVAEALHSGADAGCVAMWFGGLGFCVLAVVVFRRSGARLPF
jgi:hypothetical protein